MLQPFKIFWLLINFQLAVQVHFSLVVL